MTYRCIICCVVVSNVKSLLAGVCMCVMCLCVCVNSDDVAAYKKVEDRGSPLPDGCEYWSGKLSDVVETNRPEAGGHKGHVQKSQSYYDKDIFIYVYIQYFHILKA